MHRIEFGRHEGSKWVAELTLSYPTFTEAKSALQVVSQELQDDQEYYQAERTQVKMFGPTEHLYHYITANFPRVALPSNEVA